MSDVQFMGILNVTPDSFSGDGTVALEPILLRFEELVRDGVDIIDLGSESTRPGATPLTAVQEWKRLEAPLDALVRHPMRSQVTLSLDSYHPETIRRAMDYGIDMVNDVTGLRADAMLQVLAEFAGRIVVMHSLTVPADPAICWEPDADPVEEILHWKQAIITRSLRAGIDPTRLIFDPGIGFGKTAQQSLALVRRAEELVASGGCWLYGHSRKSFLKLALGNEADMARRDEATLLVSAMLVDAGVQLLRVHDVARHRTLLERLCI